MLSFLTDELVWAAIREREDEARSTHPHTEGWPKAQRSMPAPRVIGDWLTWALRKRASHAPQYR